MKRPPRATKAPTPRARKKAPAEAAPPPPEVAVESLVEAPLPADLTTTHVEPVFANRVPPAPPDRPFPSSHRAIFFDVENTSRAAHIARVIEHLAVDRVGRRTDFVAVGNWRVIGHDTARLLARHGAHLVHSAPSVGVRDWSDLRIAVAAGVWLASARPGDVIEIVSDDRAFDAVGDVSTSLGIAFRRLSFRGLTGDGPRPVEVVESAPAQSASGGRHHSRRRGRGGWRDRQPTPRSETASSPPPSPTRTQVPRPQLAEEPHTAPLDELVTIVQDLVTNASGRVVTIDTLANALKSRGFSRPPGSPRLITRLRRIKELTVSRSGAITLTTSDAAPGAEEPVEVEPGAGNVRHVAQLAGWPIDSGEDLSVGPGNVAPPDGGAVASPGSGSAGATPRRGRRSRRGGRRHRRRGAGAPAPAS
jgi:hypothetical protein